MSDTLSRRANLTAAEKRAMIARLIRKQARAEHPAQGFVPQDFEAASLRTPRAIAMSFEGRELTYAELNASANQLAHRLQSLGVGRESLVGICVERSPEMLVALLAILKAGGAYVPMDPAYPEARLRHMLDDAQVPVLVTEESVREHLPKSNARVVSLDGDWAEIAAYSEDNLSVAVTSSDLSYVIYTSGSTGKPKGVQISHGALANFLASMRRQLGMTPRDVLLSVTTLSFDIAALELFLPLTMGARLWLISRDAAADGAQLIEQLHRSSATFLQATPATWRLLLEAGWTGSPKLNMLCGGEALPRELANRLLSRGQRLWNLYGPTETTIWSSTAKVKLEEGAVPIGSPIANTQIYVLDSRLRPVPVGVAGELYIGGAGVARGYMNHPGLTAERFLPDSLGHVPGGRLYKTGDLGRWRADGTLEFLGRSDEQVKIRGFRVELGEVESALARHPNVREAVVVAREDGSGEKQLAGYVVVRDGQGPSALELRQWLKESLPEFMVPSAVMFLESLPLTPNGKVDRRALPSLEGQRPLPGVTFTPPRNAIEEVVASILMAVLDLERVGIDDNFFELGGHSLLATQVVSRLRESLGVEVPLRALFEAPTVSGLAERIESARQGSRSASATRIERVPRDRELPLSYAQEALWFLEQLSPGQPTFNVTGAVRILGALDTGALQQSFSEIVRRHEALRTTFGAVEGRPIQVVAPALDLPLTVIDLREWPAETRQAETERLASEEARRPFDLARGPLMRASLIRLAGNDNAVLMTMHHIVTDGWSLGIAARELGALYDAFRGGKPSPLPELPIQYADFACWQRQWLQGKVFEKLLGYWKRQLSGVTPLELPTDRPRPAARTSRGALVSFELRETLSRNLQELSQRAGSTMFMTLLAAFQTLLHRYSGQDDITVGSPVANRNRTETEGLIGYFVNMLALRTDLSGDPSFRELLARVRDVSLGAFEHQDFPLEKLVETLQLVRDVSRSPLFQVMFVFQNNQLPDVGRRDLTLGPLHDDAGNGTAKFDLSLAMSETERGLAGSLEYNTDLFDADTAARMIGHFQTLLSGIVANPDTPLSLLPILTETERQQLLPGWSHTPSDRTRAVCVHQRFEAQAARTPEAIALVSAGERLAYGDLNQRANQIARHLRWLGVGPESLVGICVRNPLDMISGLLAVLKAGGAYVPLDPDLPAQRLKYMMSEAGLTVLLTEDQVSTLLPEHGAAVVCLDSQWAAIAEQGTENLANVALPDNLAYLIYTSGSVGTPKGVSITHASLANAYQAWEQAYELRSETSCHLQMANFAFDVFTGDWVRALCSGATLVACPRDILLDPRELHRLILSERVDCAEFVPAVVESLIAYLEQTRGTLESMRLVVVGSDQWHAGAYERLRRLCGVKTRVVNSYGLTEATIDSLYFEGSLSERQPSRPVPVGRPFARTRVYLLDRSLQPVPVGVPGEVYVGGMGLARGYHRRPRLTAEKFIPDPFSGVPGAQLYKSGDLARWLPDGNIELLGRIDHQVKIRGFRVELAEVEAALLQHTGVRDAVAVVREDDAGDKHLAAYFVPRARSTLDETELRRFLKERLPRYMIPSLFATLEALPLTPSGKVDRQALPPPQRVPSKRQEAAVPPRDTVEAELAEIWEDVLGIRPVGVTDNFFDLGGHSLLAVRLASNVESRFGRRLSLSTLFQGATIEELAALLREHPAPQSWSPLVAMRTSGSLPPFFCVHPIGGHVLAYHELARLLGSERPVYGLQAAGLDGEQEPATRLDEMAARYAEAIRAAQPAGPYHLAGWSLGGVIAFEIACQVRAQGHDVATLALIDCHAPAPGLTGRPIDDAEILIAFATDLAQGLDTDVRIPISLTSDFDPESDVLSHLETMGLGVRMRADIGPDRLQRLWKVFRANYLALATYTPRLYPGRLTLFRAGHRLVEGVVDPALGWNALAAGGVSTHVLHGDHYALLKQPAVEKLAEILRSRMS